MASSKLLSRSRGKLRRNWISARGKRPWPLVFRSPTGAGLPGLKDAHGTALVAQLGPDEFLVTGLDASVSFHAPGKLPWVRSQIVTAEQGVYENGVWKRQKLWNGDETDRGLCFYEKPVVVRVRLGRF
jgi:hypothetical protein